MTEDLNALYNSLLELQTAEEITNFEIEKVEKEFDNYLASYEDNNGEKKDPVNRLSLRIFAENLKQLDEEKEKRVAAQNKLISWLIGGAIFIAGMTYASQFLDVFFPSVEGILPLKLWFIFGGWTCSSVWHYKTFKDFFVTRRNGEKEMKKKSENNEEYQYLYNLWKKANSLKEEKETHHRNLEKYKKKFVKLLERLMQEKCNEMGIHKVIKIERASLIPGSSNGLKLELKAPKEEVKNAKDAKKS